MTVDQVDSGNEYYPLDIYAKDKNQNELYASKADKSQFYLSKTINGKVKEVMAKQQNTNKEFEPFFAFDKENDPICPLLTENQKCLAENVPYPKKNKKEKYPKRHQHEYYVDRGQGMTYAKNENQDDYCAINSQGKRYYAFTTTSENEEVEFPPQKKNKENIYIEEGNNIIYPLNITKNLPVYATDKDGNEVYFQKNNVEVYGRNKSNLPIYAKYQDGKDRPALQNNVPYYSFYDKNGKTYQYYPKLKDKTEFYIKEGNKEKYAKFDNDERYAQNLNKNDILAKEDNIPYYAINKDNIEMYPQVEGEKYYRKADNIERIAFDKNSNKGFYAKNKQEDEFYPKNFKDVLEDETVVVKVDAPQEPTDDEIKIHMASRD